MRSIIRGLVKYVVVVGNQQGGAKKIPYGTRRLAAHCAKNALLVINEIRDLGVEIGDFMQGIKAARPFPGGGWGGLGKSEGFKNYPLCLTTGRENAHFVSSQIAQNRRRKSSSYSIQVTDAIPHIGGIHAVRGLSGQT